MVKQVRAAPSTHQKLGWAIKPAFCLFSLLRISHLFLADKRALIWRSQDAGVSLSVVTGLVYRNHSSLLGCLTLWLLFRWWRPRGKSTHRSLPLCRSSSSHISSVVRRVQLSPSPPAVFLTGAVCKHSPKLVSPAVWKSPSSIIGCETHSDVFNEVIMLSLNNAWKLKGRRIPAEKINP